MNTIAERWGAIEERVAAACARAGRAREEVTIVAVSKVHPVSAIAQAHDAGARLFGENYVQEWLGKAEADALVGRDLQWAFIGKLQRNKVRHLLGRVQCIETVDSERLAREIARRAADRGRIPQSVLLQVNLSAEPSKGGFAAETLDRVLPELIALPGLSIDGLMHIPPRRPTLDETRLDHRNLATLRDRLAGAISQPLPELSMGMSADFEVAIEEGATRVRVGTALFGPRSR